MYVYKTTLPVCHCFCTTPLSCKVSNHSFLVSRWFFSRSKNTPLWINRIVVLVVNPVFTSISVFKASTASNRSSARIKNYFFSFSSTILAKALRRVKLNSVMLIAAILQWPMHISLYRMGTVPCIPKVHLPYKVCSFHIGLIHSL